MKPRTGELIREGETVALGRRAFKVLLVLLDAGGELVSNEDILQRVWDGTVVEHNTVQAQISALRKALGEDRSLLRTYPGRGYRLMTPSQDALAAVPGVRAPGGADGAFEPPIARHLPLPLTSLIGREAAVEELVDLVSEQRLVTAAGPGGIGKTRLVIEAVRRSARAFDGRVFFADLAALSDGDLVAPTIVAGFGGGAGVHASLADSARALDDGPVLVVLDNCEHLVEAATRAAETLLRANARIHVVATSREPLKASGEVVYRVASLDVPGGASNTGATLNARGASRLFLERAGIDERDLVDDPVRADAIAKITRDLDGIPLAIELAAARARSLGVLEVASRLDECLDLLRGGDRTALPRHRTLRATLEWSHDALSAAERIVLRRLAVFVGGFRLEAACRVASDETLGAIDVVGLVADLVEKSLVSTDQGPAPSRYRLLETTRAFALERLAAADETNTVAERHAGYRLEVLEQVDPHSQTPRHLPTLESFRAEVDNHRAALDWAFGDHGDPRLGFALASRVAPLMLDLLMTEECLSRSMLALARTPPDARGDPVRELKLRTAVASSRVYVEGPGDAAMRSWTEVLVRSRSVGDRGFEIRALWGLWTVCTFAGSSRHALHWAVAFARVARRSGNADSVVLADRVLGIAYHYLGRQPKARARLESMIGRYVHGAHPITMAGLMNHRTVARATLARVLWFQGYPDRAVATMRESVEEALAEDHALSISYVLVECALPLSLLVGDRRGARHHLALLSASSRRQGLVVLQVIGRCYEALLESDGAPSARALVDLTATFDRVSTLHFHAYSADLANRLARALADAGRHDEALALCERSLERTARSGEQLWKAESLRTRALLRLGSRAAATFAGAEADLREAMAVASDQGSLSLELRAATTLARLLATRGYAPEGRRLLEAVYGRFTEGFDTPDLVDGRSLLASSSPAPPGAR